jgi:anti-anti-sigma factor
LRPQLELSVERRGSARRIAACGELDLATGGRLERVLLDAARLDIELDLGEVTFIDSAGVRVLINAANGCRERGTILRLEPVSAAVQRVLDMLRANDILSFPVRDGRAEWGELRLRLDDRVAGQASPPPTCQG